MTTKNKINLSIVVFLLLSLLLILFLISPLFSDIKKNSQELISQKKKIAILENEIRNVEEFKKDYQKIKPNLEEIETFFTNSEAPINFITFLENNSQDCGISIKIIPASLIRASEDPWPAIGFTINTAGPFSNFLRFLEKLESSPYLIEVLNLNIRGLTEGELKLKDFEMFSLGGVQASFLVKVFTK
jgi:hypothetical protein